jgi:two-component system, sensor histidine kinase and response regulator
LAEDNRVNQKLTIRLLEKRGHQVLLAGNGREALDALAQHSFDPARMGVHMPGMDGVDATIALREREKLTGLHQLLIAVTALAMKEDRERCIAAGMDGYLSKPIDLGELDTVLATYETGIPASSRYRSRSRSAWQSTLKLLPQLSIQLRSGCPD